MRRDALAAGIEGALFDRALAGVRPAPSVVARDRAQPEARQTLADYLARRAGPGVIAAARRRADANAALLARLEAAYGVAGAYLVAIWAIESGFGANMGDVSVIQALVTLAWDPRRGDQFRAELLDALRILQRGEARVTDFTGSYAGAFGQTQFLPSSFLQYAVDFDGDGRRDVWRSTADALASTANYLREKGGWQTGMRWGRRVRLPRGFDTSLAEDRRVFVNARPLAAWARLGVTQGDGAPLPAADVTAGLILPDGPGGPAFLAYHNFQAIMTYNSSYKYALAVCTIADGVGGG